MRQLAPLFGVSKSAAVRIIDDLGLMLALQPRKRFAKDTVLIVDGTLAATWDRTVAERSKFRCRPRALIQLPSSAISTTARHACGRPRLSQVRENSSTAAVSPAMQALRAPARP